LDKLSGGARQQAMNINLVDQEIHWLQVQLKICQTARNAYATAFAASATEGSVRRGETASEVHVRRNPPNEIRGPAQPVRT
jgi:hypothetical protein